MTILAQSIARKTALAGLLAGTVLAGSAGAQAGQIEHTFQNVTFDDGATLSGSFVTDSSTGAVESAAFTSTAGRLSGYSYNYPGASFLSQPSFFNNDNPDSFYFTNGGNYIDLAFANPLTSTGANTILTNQSYECDNCGTVRYVTGGDAFAAGAPVPEPISMAVLGTGLLGLSLARRRARG